MALRGSIEFATTRLLTSSMVVTRAARANAASVAAKSQRSLSQSNTTLPGMWSNSCGAPGSIAARDPRVRRRRTQHVRMHHARQRDVVGIAALPGDEPKVLESPQRLADREFHIASKFCRSLQSGSRSFPPLKGRVAAGGGVG